MSNEIQKTDDKILLFKTLIHLSGLKMKYADECELIPIIIRLKPEASEEEFENKIFKFTGKKTEKIKTFNFSAVVTRNQLDKLDGIDEIDFYTVQGGEPSYVN